MHKIIFALTLVSIISVTAFTQQTNTTTDPKARALEVLKQARAAIWNDAKKPLQSLSINATSRRSMGAGEMSTDVTVEMLMPDKFLRTDETNFGTIIQAINGAQFWSDFKQNEMAGGFGGGGNVVIAGGGPGMVFNRGGGDGGGGGGPMRVGGGGQVFGGMPGQQAPAADFGRLLLSWLLIAPAPLQAEFAYFGEAKAEGKTADVIDVTGPNNFAVRLFIDQQAHQLMVMSFKTKMVSRMVMGPPPGQAPGQTPGQAPGQASGQVTGQPPRQTPPNGNPPPNATGNTGGAGGPGGNAGGNRGPEMRQITPEDMEKMRASMANAPDVEARWYLSDYRSEGGLTLPHTIIKSTNGQTSEQMDIKKVKINPSLKADKFVKKEEKKEEKK